MSYTIYKSTSGLIAQPGRAVSTFPSGLVRVEQSYMGLTANAATHRATLAVGNNMPDGDSSPCIDGLKIFPEVQEVRREDGFTEYKVCAYGRSNTTGSTQSNFENGFAQLYINVIMGGTMTNSENSFDCLNEVLVFSKVVLAEAFPSILPEGVVIRSWLGDPENPGEYTLLQNIYPPGTFTQPSGGTLHSTITTTRSVTTTAQIIQNSSTIYGSFKEQVLTLRASTVVNESVIYS